MYIIVAGLHDLQHDNLTEHPSTINVLARMNVYQEVVLAAIYRTFPFIKVCQSRFLEFKLLLTEL